MMRSRRARLALISAALTAGALVSVKAEIFYPWKGTYIGALEGKEWFGLVLAPAKGVFFGLSLKVRKAGQAVGSEDFFYLVSEVGPHSPDGSYSRVAADLSLPPKQGNDTPILIKPPPKSETLTLEWSRQDENTVLGRIRAPKDIIFQVVHYFPWDLKGAYRLRPDGQVQGQNQEGKPYYYLFWTNRAGEALPSPEGGGLPLSFSTEKDRTLYFIAAVGEDPRVLNDQIYRYKNWKTIESLPARGGVAVPEQTGEDRRPLRGRRGSRQQQSFWMMLYQPDQHRLYTSGTSLALPPARRVAGSMDDLRMGFFLSALEISIESGQLARDVVAAVLRPSTPTATYPIGGPVERT
jgi:hypothetical protein